MAEALGRPPLGFFEAVLDEIGMSKEFATNVLNVEAAQSLDSAYVNLTVTVEVVRAIPLRRANELGQMAQPKEEGNSE